MRAFSTLCALALAVMVHATHIIGGELYYTHLSGDQYEVTLKLFRDCGPGNELGTGFDADVEIGVFDEAGNYLTSYHIPTPNEGEQIVPVDLSNQCLTAPPSICVRQMTYTHTITLTSGQGGYQLSYQRCCRTPTIINLAPFLQGITCTVHVPDPAVVGANSSPRFNAYPPIALCAQQSMAIDLSASDPDGDSLAYDLCAPFVGGDSQFNIIPSPPSGPPYQPVQWAGGYSVAHMMDAAPPLTIDPVTGQLTVTPTMIGSYVVGVRVREFRNGVELSEVVRDFRFDVTNCTVNVVSVIAEQEAASFCAGTTVHLDNNSIGGESYHWDFGVAQSSSDTSALAEPTFTYPDTGLYTVTLIANPGWPCADTSTRQVALYDPVQVSYVAPAILCPTQFPVQLTATGNLSDHAAVVWDIGTGVAQSLNTPGIAIQSFDLGSHAVRVDVTDHGCTGNYMDSVRVYPLPVAEMTVDTNGCVAFTPTLTNTSHAWTPLTYLWEFGDDGTSTDSLPTHTYIHPGTYSVRLTVSTSSGCIGQDVQWLPDAVDVWPLPHAAITADPLVTSLMDPQVTFTDASVDAAQLDINVAGTHYTVPQFTHFFDDAGRYHVTVTATSGLGCVDTASVDIFVGDHFFYAPNAFSPNGDNTNEVWLPQVKGARLYNLAVFDRWGRMRFSTTDPKQGWDGKDAEPGVYVYKAWLSEYGPLEQEYNGSITLLR